MSYSENFKQSLSQFLDNEFLGQREIDTIALDSSTEINALAEKWCKYGANLRESASTIEDKFAVFQIQSLGQIMEAISYAVPSKRQH
jgi:hypothetical protein